MTQTLSDSAPTVDWFIRKPVKAIRYLPDGSNFAEVWDWIEYHVPSLTQIALKTELGHRTIFIYRFVAGQDQVTLLRSDWLVVEDRDVFSANHERFQRTFLPFGAIASNTDNDGINVTDAEKALVSAPEVE